MADFRDNYFTLYTLDIATKFGSYAARNSPSTSFTGVAYKIVQPEESKAAGNEVVNEVTQQTSEWFQLWTITLVNGTFSLGQYVPKQGDEFTDANNQTWNVEEVDFPEGVTNSNGVRPTVNIRCIRVL